MQFHDVRFPSTLSFGAIGGPERRTEIVTLSNGFEERNSPWSQSRRLYDAGLGMRSLDDLENVIAFFEARQGQLYAFRWKDWSDYKSCAPSRDVDFGDQVIGIGDGRTTRWQLIKTYRSGAHSAVREITKPVDGSVRVGVQGTNQIEGQHFHVNLSNGVIEFDLPPSQGLEITAGFEFDVPVRFDTPSIQVNLASFNAGDVPSVPVVEVRL